MITLYLLPFVALLANAQICHDTGPVQQTTENCVLIPADVVFCMDGSESISPSGFAEQKEFMWEFLEHLWKDIIGPDAAKDTLVGTHQFSTFARTEFALGDHTDYSNVQSKIQAIDQVIGATNIRDCLELTRTSGGRGGAIDFPKFSVLVSDGDGTLNEANQTATVESLKAEGWIVVAVGVAHASLGKLEDIASPGLAYYYSDFNTLIAEMEDIIHGLCDQYAYQTCGSAATIHTLLSFYAPSCPVSCTFAEALKAEIQQNICEYLNQQVPGRCPAPSMIPVTITDITFRYPMECGSVHPHVQFNDSPALAITANQLATTLQEALPTATTPLLDTQFLFYSCEHPTGGLDEFETCTGSPCASSSCVDPDAVCQDNFCGGCNAIWYTKNGDLSTCTLLD